MLHIKIPDGRYYDDETERFFTIKGGDVQMEHSLVSISKWEAKWHKPFLGSDAKTPAEIRDYYRCMTLTQHIDPAVFLNVTPELQDKIQAYIDDPMTATTVSHVSKGQQTVVTSELIYYWMTAFNIPFECQKWHLNRLLMLISVCNAKNAPAKKMSQRDVAQRYRELNAARRGKKKPKR